MRSLISSLLLLVSVATLAQPCALRIDSQRTGELFIDGHSAGQLSTGPCTLFLQPGEHQLRLTSATLPDWQLTVQLKEPYYTQAAPTPDADEDQDPLVYHPNLTHVFCPSPLYPSDNTHGTRAIATGDWPKVARYYQQAPQTPAARYAYMVAISHTNPTQVVPLALAFMNEGPASAYAIPSMTLAANTHPLRMLPELLKIIDAYAGVPYGSTALELALTHAPDRMVPIARRIAEAHPDAGNGAQAASLLIQHHMKTKDYPRAIARYVQHQIKLSELPDYPATCLKIAIGYYRTGAFEQSYMTMYHLVQEYPSDPYADKARTFLPKVRQKITAPPETLPALPAAPKRPARKSIQACQAALAADPPPEALHKLYIELAGAHYSAEQYQEAAAANLTAAQSPGPYHSALRFRAASCYTKAKDYHAAIPHLRYILQRADASEDIKAAALYWLGDSQFQTEQHDDAYQSFRWVSHAFPESPWGGHHTSRPANLAKLDRAVLGQ